MDSRERELTEKELIEHCLADKRQYQKMLYRKYADNMYRVCMIYSHNEDDACDVLQNGFIKVFRHLHKFRFECPVEGWIRRIMVNTALELYRKKNREREVYEDYKHTQVSVIDDILEKINAAEIIRLVNSLPSRASMVLKLYAIEGHGHKEIADLLGISEGTSKSQLNRARSLLKEKISKTDG